jgi:SAM-dependent methyltransferase
VSSRLDRGDWRDWRWDETLFAGAAPYYVRGRPPYASGLADAMRDALGLDGTGRLLDVGCGPGIVALLVAHLFEEAVGLDPDQGMLAEAQRRAREAGIANARWVRMRAEELPAGLGAFRLITFAASLHWMDRPAVFATVREMLAPGGVVIHVDNPGYRWEVPETTAFPHPMIPNTAITELRKAYLGPDQRAGRGIRNNSPGDEDAIFRASGFAGPEVVVVPDSRVLERTTDDVVAWFFSGSGGAPHLFGDRLGEYEADLRALLADASPHGLFSVPLSDNLLRIWRPT